jgi:hypothetical protein
MNSLLAWFITFNFINIAWIFFRAKEFGDALKVLKGMFGFSGITLSEKYFSFLHPAKESIISLGEVFEHLHAKPNIFVFNITALILVLMFKNSNEIKDNLKFDYKHMLFFVAISLYSLLNINKVSEFLYFNF